MYTYVNEYKCMDVFLCIHIVTDIFIVTIVRVLLHFKNKNLYIGGF